MKAMSDKLKRAKAKTTKKWREIAKECKKKSPNMTDIWDIAENVTSCGFCREYMHESPPHDRCSTCPLRIGGVVCWQWPLWTQAWVRKSPKSMLQLAALVLKRTKEAKD